MSCSSCRAEDIDLAVLKKMEELVQAGATIVGPKPTRLAD